MNALEKQGCGDRFVPQNPRHFKEQIFVQLAVKTHRVDVESAALSRKNSEGGVHAVQRVFEGESAMRGDDRVKIRKQIVEKIQVDEMSEGGETRQRGTQQRRITT